MSSDLYLRGFRRTSHKPYKLKLIVFLKAANKIEGLGSFFLGGWCGFFSGLFIIWDANNIPKQKRIRVLVLLSYYGMGVIIQKCKIFFKTISVNAEIFKWAHFM